MRHILCLLFIALLLPEVGWGQDGNELLRLQELMKEKKKTLLPAPLDLNAHKYSESIKILYGRIGKINRSFDYYFSRNEAVQINAPVHFLYTDFDSFGDFSCAVFDSECYFNRADFYAKSSFSKAKFYTLGSFWNARFRAKCNFCQAYFASRADFNFARFDSTIFFSNVSFNKDAGFIYTRFRNNASFDHLQVTTNTVFDFSHALLPDSIDFSHNSFLDMRTMMDLTRTDSLPSSIQMAVQKPFWKTVYSSIYHYFYPYDTTGFYRKCHINLYNTDVSKIKINYDDFKFYAYDLENKDSAKQVISRDVIEPIYEGLLKNFKDRGQMDSYDKMDIEYQRYKAGIAEDEFSFLDWWWRYGHEKWRIFIHAVLLIFFFSIINFFILHKLNGRQDGYYYNKMNARVPGVYEIDNIPDFAPHRWGFSLKRIGAAAKRFWYSLMYTSIIFFLLTLKIEKVRFGKPLSVWVMVIYTVGLICMGFMANLILQK